LVKVFEKRGDGSNREKGKGGEGEKGKGGQKDIPT
jgi:hypothetical protein